MKQTEIDPILTEFQEEDAELAEQLLALRRQPGPQLRRRIGIIPHQKTRRPGLIPRWAWGVAVLLAAGVLFISPTARATLGEVETMIGQIRLTMLDVYPEPATPIVVESVPMSLSEARAAVPFTFGAPAYLPDRLTGPQETFVTYLEQPFVKLRWRDSEGGFVQVTAHAANRETNTLKTLIGATGSEPITLNGNPAVLVRGAWSESSRTWGHRDQVTTIIWESEGVHYRLLSYSDILPAAELIKMAASVR